MDNYAFILNDKIVIYYKLEYTKNNIHDKSRGLDFDFDRDLSLSFLSFGSILAAKLFISYSLSSAANSGEQDSSQRTTAYLIFYVLSLNVSSIDRIL